MRLLVSGATVDMARLRQTPRGDRLLGQLMVPGTWGGCPDLGLPWACDNGCFGGLDEAAFIEMLEKVARNPSPKSRTELKCLAVKPLWVAAPDVVGDAKATLDLWPGWMMRIATYGLEPCFVLQDGAEHYRDLPAAKAFFIGGTTSWKESREAYDLASLVKERGAWLHMGRVNTWRRFKWAWKCECDSIDGSGFSAWPGTRIPKALRWLERLDPHPHLFSSPRSEA